MNIVYTSGTTGPAKGAVLPHGYAWEQATIKIEQWGLTAADVLFTALPLYHVNARFSTLCTSIVAGARARSSARSPRASSGTRSAERAPRRSASLARSRRSSCCRNQIRLSEITE